MKKTLTLSQIQKILGEVNIETKISDITIPFSEIMRKLEQSEY